MIFVLFTVERFYNSPLVDVHLQRQYVYLCNIACEGEIRDRQMCGDMPQQADTLKAEVSAATVVMTHFYIISSKWTNSLSYFSVCTRRPFSLTDLLTM